LIKDPYDSISLDDASDFSLLSEPHFVPESFDFESADQVGRLLRERNEYR
jgi:hypothetical protein